MANSFTASNEKVVGVVDTTGASTSIRVQAARLVDLSLNFDTGTFSGTVALQRQTDTGATGNDLNWVTISSYTASGEVTFRSATTRNYRINVTVNSGILYFELSGGNKGI